MKCVFPSNLHQWLALSAIAMLAACAQPERVEHAQRSNNPDLWPHIESPFDPAETARIDREIDALLARMTVAQKVGQITQGEVSRATPEDVKNYHLGSVLNGGGGFLHGDKHASVADWVEAMDAYYMASMDTSDGGLAIPIVWGTDAVHGHNKIYGATVFPHNIGLGATRNGELVREISAVTAKQVRATGIDWTFSPQVSIVRDLRWGRTYESYGEEPGLVAAMGRQSILGYQGDLADGTFMNADRIIATAKHYIGDGGTIDGIDRGNNLSSEQKLIDIHAPSYFAAIEAGALTLMASHNSWHGVRLHGERYLLTDILKERLGFDGMVIGDWNSHGLIEGCTNTRCPQSVNAGVDMMMVPFEWREFIEHTIEDVNNGAIPMARLDDAVRRVLRTKYRAGLMTAPKPSERHLANQEALLAAPELRALGRQAVRESMVLLKNNHNLLPLQPNQKVLIAGTGAHNIAQQTGGWTISWQSTDLTNDDFPNGTSIYQGIRNAVTAAGGYAVLSEDGRYQDKPEVAIVVYGETPYAEWQGDVRHLAFEYQDNHHAKILEQLQADGIKTVSVFLSGRPMWVNRALNASDAFIAAWLPGTEGDGVAEVLFTDSEGEVRYDFSGRLPFSWPKTPTQATTNVGDADYSPLFPFDYGLTYQSTDVEVAKLPAEALLAEVQESEQVTLFDGITHEPWQMFVAAQDQSLKRYISGIAQNGALTLTEADQVTQGDAVNALWDGSSPSSLQINVPGANRNLSAIYAQDAALVFDLRLLQSGTDRIRVGMACRDPDCSAAVDITTLVNASPRNDWNSLSVSLACFANQGIHFGEVTQIFALETAGELEVQLTNISLQPGMGDRAGVMCHPQ